MNKSQLIDAVAGDTGLTKADCEKAVNAILDNIKKNTVEGVQLIGFGSFNVSERQARKGRNPRTGKEITIPASKTIKFKSGTAYRDLVN